jgi:hypothetical protein
MSSRSSAAAKKPINLKHIPVLTRRGIEAAGSGPSSSSVSAFFSMFSSSMGDQSEAAPSSSQPFTISDSGPSSTSHPQLEEYHTLAFSDLSGAYSVDGKLESNFLPHIVTNVDSVWPGIDSETGQLVVPPGLPMMPVDNHHQPPGFQYHDYYHPSPFEIIPSDPPSHQHHSPPLGIFPTSHIDVGATMTSSHGLDRTFDSGSLQDHGNQIYLPVGFTNTVSPHAYGFENSFVPQDVDHISTSINLSVPVWNSCYY